MTPNIDAGRAHRDAAQAYAEFRAHAHSQQYGACVKWIDSLLVQQQATMVDCGKDKLADAQVRLKQLRALRSALVDPGGASTGHVFD